MIESVSENEAPPFQEGLEIAKFPDFSVVYGYRDPQDKTESEQRIFVVPLNKMAEQVLRTFANRNTLPMATNARSEEFSAALLRGDFSHIIQQLNEMHSSDGVPSIQELETHIKQIEIETADEQEGKHVPSDILQNISEALAPLQKRAEEAKNSAAELKEKLANIDPKEVAQDILKQAQEKLVEKLKEFKIEAKLHPIAIAIVIMAVTSPIHYATIYNINQTGELANTGGHLIENIKAYYEIVSEWEKGAFFYLPIVSGVITAFSLTLLGLGIKIKKRENEPTN